jgi:hypothetical protein
VNDQLDQAIAAVPEKVATLTEVRVQISSTGRPVVLLVPDDLSDVEIIELTSFVLIGLRQHLASQASPASRLFVPGRT